jgi:hypothetical protein
LSEWTPPTKETMRLHSAFRAINVSLFVLFAVVGSAFANPCSVAISVSPHGTFPFTAAGGSGSFTVNTGGTGGVSCTWSLTSASFIHASPTSGGGGSQFQFTVNFTVDPNPDLAARSGLITVTQVDQTSTSETITESAATGDFSIAVAPSSETINAGDNGTANITISRTGAFTGAVALSATGQPSGVTVSFNPSSTSGNTSTMTIATTRTATTGQFPIVIKGVNTGVSHTTTLTLTVAARPWQTRDISLLNGAPLAATGTALVGHMNTLAAPNVDEVFNFDQNMHVDSPWFNGTWHVTDVTGVAGAPAGASSALTSHINTLANVDEVFYLDSNQDVDSLWWDGTTWHVTGVTTVAGAGPAAAGSALTSHVNTLGNSDEVFYLASNGHVNALWWQSFQWHVSDVSAVAGGAVAVAGSALSSHFSTVANVDEVFYLDSSQNVDSLWWDGTTWHVTDVTIAAGAPVAAAGSALISHVNTLANSDEVYFLDANGHVDELWWQNSQWHASDVTSAVGAPLAAPGSALAGYINTVDHLDEIVYLGQDHHVNLLAWDSTTFTWHFTDLTLATGAPPAAAGSALNSHFNTVSSADQVFFMGADQHLHVLFR